MAEVYSKALDRTLRTDRIIGHIKGDLPGPTVVFLGGIHGNEPAGVFALDQVVNDLKDKSVIRGNMYAVSGNLWALERGMRYQEHDLNRIWMPKWMENGVEKNEDLRQQKEIHELIGEILEKETGPFYFIDLHTTSSPSRSFLTVNDSLLNRKFTAQYPIPVILGLEEYLDGTWLSYMNELGYVAFGYEGGRHEDIASIENHTAFVYLTLVFAGLLDEDDVPEFRSYYGSLTDTPGIYEIRHRHVINKGDTFRMEPGFSNFQHIRRGTLLATSNTAPVLAPRSGRVFLPLYQDQGDDGFFLVRKIHRIFLQLSAFLRKIRYDRVLTLLPGVRWRSAKRDQLIVNRKVAQFLAKEFFHLLGYRSREMDKENLIMKNREAASRKSSYRSARWYR